MRRFRAIIFALSFSALLATGLSVALPASAQTNTANTANAPASLQLEVPIPASPLEQAVGNAANGSISDVSQYIGRLYNFLIGIIGMVAAVMMIMGGFQYLTSAGDSGKIGAAKKRIGDALIGVVLALGAYVILNTINPALLKFEPLSARVKEVGTVTFFLPWCEDLIGATPRVDVTQVNGKDCGNVGTYQAGNTTSYCVYRGECTPDRGDGKFNFGGGEPAHGVETCLQRSGLTPKFIGDSLAKDKTSTFGLCLPCANITKSVAGSLGMTIADACQVWQTTVTDFRTKEFKDVTQQNLWSYCGPASGYPGCVQADVDCAKANDNQYDGSSCDGHGDSGHHSCGCEGYNDEPAPVWPKADMTPDQEKGIGDGSHSSLWGSASTMRHYEAHLDALCSLNPCQNFKDTRVTPQQDGTQYGYVAGAPKIGTMHIQSYVKGCSGVGLVQYVPGARAFAGSCSNLQ